MKTVTINLGSIDKVKSFVNDITKFVTDIRLGFRTLCYRGKIYYGIFSLDLSKPIDLNIHNEDNLDEILEVLKKYDKA